MGTQCLLFPRASTGEIIDSYANVGARLHENDEAFVQ